MNNKPVAFIDCFSGKPKLIDGYVIQTEYDIPLYTHPVKELTNAEIDKIENAIYCKTIQKGKTQNEYIKAFARAILRKAQEK